MLRPGRAGHIEKDHVGIVDARVNIHRLTPAHMRVEPILRRDGRVGRDPVDDRLRPAVVIGFRQRQKIAAPRQIAPQDLAHQRAAEDDNCN